jgi:hypothetical protein
MGLSGSSPMVESAFQQVNQSDFSDILQEITFSQLLPLHSALNYHQLFVDYKE